MFPYLPRVKLLRLPCLRSVGASGDEISPMSSGSGDRRGPFGGTNFIWIQSMNVWMYVYTYHGSGDDESIHDYNIYIHIHIYLYVFDGFGDLSIYRTIWIGSTRPNTLVPFENRWRLWRFHQLCGFISSFTWHIFDAQSRFSSWIFARSQAMCVLWQRSPGRQWRI